jgi:predicted metal-dependent peptidase
MRPSKLVDIYCDARMQGIHEYTHGETILPRVTGRGGTSYRPVFEHIAQMDEKPRCVVYLTDLEPNDGFPPDPGIPIIWCVCGPKDKVPYGEVVHVT